MAKLRGTKPVVNLYGSGGVGKTTLGKEICRKWPGRHIFVDLREVTDMKDVYFHIMLALDPERTVITYDENPVIELLLLRAGGRRGDILLLLDNVDQFAGGDDDDAKSLNTEFIRFLQRIHKSIDNGGKVLLISRMRFQRGGRRQEGKEKEFCSDEAIDYKELEALKPRSSVEILQKASGIPATESNQMEKLVEMCKRKPLLLNGIAAILKQKIADAEKLLGTIEHELAVAKPDDNAMPPVEEGRKEMTAWDYRSEGIDEGQLSCLRKMFFFLPSDSLRHSAVALSLFCRPFSVEAAAFILDTDMSEAVVLLEGLRNSKLLSVDPETKEPVYDIHPLMRSFLRSVGGSPVFIQVYMKAKRRFCDLFMTKMKHIAALLDKDYMSAFEQFDIDKPNFELALNISFNTDYLHISNEYHEIIMMCHLFEAMLDANQRRKIFQSWAEATEEDGKEGKSEYLRM